MSEIENQFDTIASEINAKIKEAAEALKQANLLAKKHGLKTLHIHPHSNGLSDYGVDTNNATENTLHYQVIDRVSFDPLLDEMDHAGWSSSGFEC